MHVGRLEHDARDRASDADDDGPLGRASHVSVAGPHAAERAVSAAAEGRRLHT